MKNILCELGLYTCTQARNNAHLVLHTKCIRTDSNKLMHCAFGIVRFRTLAVRHYANPSRRNGQLVSAKDFMRCYGPHAFLIHSLN